MWLFRYFDKKEYAEDFIKGKMRLMPVYYYQNIEDSSRIDNNDGLSKTGAWIDRNQVTIDLFNTNKSNKPVNMDHDARYDTQVDNAVSWQWHCICFSTQLSQELANKWKSPFVCSVNIADICDRLNHAYYHDITEQYRCYPIHYTDDKDFFINSIEGKDDGEKIFLRDIFTKRTSYQSEHEYRVCVVAKGQDFDHRIIDPIYLNEREMKSAKLIDLSNIKLIK